MGIRYWRGYVWGPMMQLTYWGLQRYDHVPVARTARKALCKQMTALMLRQWHLHGHICENFGPQIAFETIMVEQGFMTEKVCFD